MPDEHDNPIWSDFSEFQNNMAIRSLADQARWTVSANLGENSKGKAPVDIKNAVFGNGVIRGAFAVNETCLMTLDELNTYVPNAVNNAFYLSAATDGMLVLDIEPGCPAVVRDKLLTLPSYYCETSMSGRGFHLLMPLPANFDDYPIAIAKQRLQEEHRWFEILIDHWVTFTRRPLPGRPDHALEQLVHGTTPPEPADPLWTWENLWASLAVKAVESPKVDFDVDEHAPDLPFSTEIIEMMVRSKPSKGPEDFNNDLSRWEFSTIGHLYNTLSNIMRASNIQRAHDWSESDLAWLLYRAATEIIPWRPKHDEPRNGLPYLLYTAHTLIAQRLGSIR